MPHKKKRKVYKRESAVYRLPKKSRFKIKEFIEKRGITPYRLAQEMGVQQGHIWNICCNKNPNPRLSMIEQIAVGLTKVTGKRVRIRDLIDES